MEISSPVDARKHRSADMPCGLKPPQVVVVDLTGAGMSTTPLGKLIFI